MRGVWAELQNRALERVSEVERVDHRSLEKQREAAQETPNPIKRHRFLARYAAGRANAEQRPKSWFSLCIPKRFQTQHYRSADQEHATNPMDQDSRIAFQLAGQPTRTDAVAGQECPITR